MIAGTIMVTQSPASTIAIVREIGAKGEIEIDKKER
jgi:hypothetical protein